MIICMDKYMEAKKTLFIKYLHLERLTQLKSGLVWECWTIKQIEYEYTIRTRCDLKNFNVY
jgi:hypothetical protein